MAESVDLLITVKAIRGRCPVYQVGDQILLREGWRLDPGQARAICMHSLASLLPYYNALAHGVDPRALGLADPEGFACVQCLDPCEETGGGTVTFRIARIGQNGHKKVPGACGSILWETGGTNPTPKEA